MTLKWTTREGRAGATFTSLRREALRLRATQDDNDLSVSEIEAFSMMLWEMAWAIAHAQRHPTGYGRALSAETLAEIKNAAVIAKTERMAVEAFGDSLSPMTGGGDVIDFNRGGKK